ncbi:pentatricopeptide repeat-containing protein At5g08510 [Rutidosis leptorrhynchoides]|uniref:pentatricopeptide repeat-containing protein At5g08510 n=1 Tax=Rutidosis leptorrhynchoides TaxID=125765 RepID=UPI003A9A6556
MNQLKRIHAHTLRTGIDFNKFLITKLLEIPNIPYAHQLFDLIPQPTVFLYNKLIQAFSSHGPHHTCFSLYTQMCFNGCSPNQHTFTSFFTASAKFNSPRHGQTLHARLVKSGYEFDIYASTALVDMYAKLGVLSYARQVFDKMTIRDVPTWNSLIAGYARNGNMEGAAKLFDEMPVKNVISWTAMISGYSQNGKYVDSLKLYLEMENLKDVQPNEVTIASILPACASLGALEVGQRIETYARKRGYFKNLFVCNALLEMYAKCGKINKAMELFEEIGARRNLCSWNTVIMGLAIHGKYNEALQLFHQMLGEGMTPDDVTFVGAILACTHGGMVKKGRELFKLMSNKFSITPKIEHYGCMVDLLGRAGELQEAYKLIQTMPMQPDSVVWGTLLGACSFHNNVELGEIAAEHLFKLEPWNPGNYVILSNIYANTGRWGGVAKLRKMMKGSQITKAAGYSFIEEGSHVYKFIVDDRSHPRSNEIYWILDEVFTKMKNNREDIFECFS